MTKKFDPAPKDKHAIPPEDATKADKSKTNLEVGLQDSFPASDPVSETQPKKPTRNRKDCCNGDKRAGAAPYRATKATKRDALDASTVDFIDRLRRATEHVRNACSIGHQTSRCG
jgi:hypothetical protein